MVGRETLNCGSNSLNSFFLDLHSPRPCKDHWYQVSSSNVEWTSRSCLHNLKCPYQPLHPSRSTVILSTIWVSFRTSYHKWWTWQSEYAYKSRYRIIPTNQTIPRRPPNVLLDSKTEYGVWSSLHISRKELPKKKNKVAAITKSSKVRWLWSPK